MIKIRDQSKCSGCTACKSVCPVYCIEMKEDAEGFYYPEADADRCISCGRCESVCPYLSDAGRRSVRMHAYGCQHPDDAVRLRSTSGGGFSLLAEEVLSLGGIVFGAAYDERMHVVHRSIDDVSDLDQLRRSKYVQSDLGDTFETIRKLLKSGKTVLFAGTPCQVEGLVMSVGSVDTQNLFTADIKCYGVPSPGLFDRFQTYLRELYGCEVEDFYFRDKKYGYFGVNVKAELKNGKTVEDRLILKSYSKTMFSKIGLRRSCYDCVFRCREKLSDFTLGDIWTIGEYDASMDDNIGTTQIEVHSEKGQQLFETIIKKTNLRYTVIFDLSGPELEAVRESWHTHYELNEEKRQAFFRDMDQIPYPELMRKHFPDTIKNRADNIMKPLIHVLPDSERIFRRKKLKKAGH